VLWFVFWVEGMFLFYLLFFFFFLGVFYINRACGFWEWIDPKMCQYGERVVGRLRE